MSGTSGETARLLGKAVEHLRYADEAYWDEDSSHVALHLAYAQAAATTARGLMEASTSGGSET